MFHHLGSPEEACVQDFWGNVIVSVMLFRFGGLFNGTAVQGETEVSFFLFWKMLEKFADCAP